MLIGREDNKEIIILIHGLMRSSKSMLRLGKHLNKQGYEIYFYNYPSTKYKIAEHGRQFKIFIQDILLNNPGKKLHFITHSLGGIVAREALGLLTEEQLNQCDRLIMLSPPNQGSFLAKYSIKWIPFLSLIIKPLGELSCSREAYVHQVTIPEKITIGIIAGRFDAKTPPSVTHLKRQNDFIVINSTHTFIMNHPKTRKAVTQFLRDGTFVINHFKNCSNF